MRADFGGAARATADQPEFTSADFVWLAAELRRRADEDWAIEAWRATRLEALKRAAMFRDGAARHE